jgi:RNA polymerase sigma-70 factor (ECF subfamily)
MPLGSGELVVVAPPRERVGALPESAELAFGDLLLHHLPSLYARARFLERTDAGADDLVQDTVERALRKFDRFERGTDLRRWLLVIMQNLFTDRWRERLRIRCQIDDLSHLAAPAPTDEDDTAPHRWELTTMNEVRQALTLVDEPLRTAFELRFFQRLSYREVAARTGVPLATVGTRILRARLRVTNVVDQRDAVEAKLPAATVADA